MKMVLKFLPLMMVSNYFFVDSMHKLKHILNGVKNQIFLCWVAPKINCFKDKLQIKKQKRSIKCLQK